MMNDLTTYPLALGTWALLGNDARSIRTEVFIHEQHIPIALEWDDMDACSLHAIAYGNDGQPVGTGRLLPDGHIGRMAVKKSSRGTGIGRAILAALMQAAKQRGDREVKLHAQITAERFYARSGFMREGQEFMEAGIPHIQMRCRLT